MQYFENKRTVDDISHVKTATLGELYGEDKKHLNMPLFYGAFKHGVIESYFSRIQGGEITDKAEIQALLEKAVLFGYCSNQNGCR